MSDGTSSSYVGLMFGGISLLGSTIATAMIMAWRGRSILAAVDAKIEKVDAKVETKVRDIKEDIKEIIRSELKLHGEGFAAIRQKIADNESETLRKMAEVELWNRDNLVRRDDNRAVIDSLNRSIEGLSSKMDSGIENLRSEMSDGNQRIEARIEDLKH